ncbi:MAG: hypothetical protein FWB97_09660 [Oscillospiraceae bacterium]|nr:hypothetical protein [Oscillospiraceae bacterium]
MGDLKKHSRVIISLAVALVAVLAAGIALNSIGGTERYAHIDEPMQSAGQNEGNGQAFFVGEPPDAQPDEAPAASERVHPNPQMHEARPPRMDEYIRGGILPYYMVRNAYFELSFAQILYEGAPSGYVVPFATVMLVLWGDYILSDEQVQRIADFIMYRIPGITYGNILITDSNLRLYPVRNPAAEADVP